MEIVLSALPETHREVLLMRFVDGMSLAEVAAALSIPEGTVKSRIHNAIATLRTDERWRACSPATRSPTAAASATSPCLR